jgi:tyrosinase
VALRKRRNQADLSSDDRKRFAAAVNKMKTDGTYDWYVRTHIDSMWMLTSGSMTMWAHMRPAFLPWHRQLLLDFENDLRAADTALRGQASDLTLPYWDWINYRSKKKFLWWGRIWGDNFMGGNGSGNENQVTDGPFQGWTMTYDAGPDYTTFPPGKAFLQRSFGTDPDADFLPTQTHWDSARALTTYDTSPFDLNVGWNPEPVPRPVRFAGIESFRNVFEGWVPYYDTATILKADQPNLHNRVHVWVGGSMGPISSPNDPVFFLHHCNVDRLWALWWSDDPTRAYLPPDGTANPVDPLGENAGGMHTGPNETIDLTGHHLHDPMPPWDGRSDPLKGTMPKISPADVLNHIALGYAYDTDPPALTATASP